MRSKAALNRIDTCRSPAPPCLPGNLVSLLSQTPRLEPAALFGLTAHHEYTGRTCDDDDDEKRNGKNHFGVMPAFPLSSHGRTYCGGFSNY